LLPHEQQRRPELLADCAVRAQQHQSSVAQAHSQHWHHVLVLLSLLQGSGWGWLGYNKESKGLEIATCANQDPLAAKVRYQQMDR
jgi:superoxide dismutase